MKLMTKVKFYFVALAVVGAAGFYYLNPGAKMDTSKDRLLQLNVEWNPSPRLLPINIRVMINGKERSYDTPLKSPWNDSVWMRPGDVVVLTAMQGDPGYITCAGVAEGVVYGPDEAGPRSLETCRVEAS